MAEYDVIIRGGTVVDGLRTPRYVSDVGIKDGRIARIGGLRRASAARELDASGLIVAPGFVDLHTHYDSQIQWDPYCSLSGWHGVTSVAIGNCGFGFAPCAPEDRDRAMLALTRNEAVPYEAMKQGMLWDWVTFPEFLDSMDRIPKAVNVLSYVPLGPIYAWVMGYEEAKARRPNRAELDEMCRLVNEGMDAGACGWTAQVLGEDSLQRDYDATPMITDLMTPDELLTFAGVLAERDAGTIELNYQVSDNSASTLGDATLQLFERVAATARRPVVFQTVRASADNAEVHRQRLRWLEDCARRKLQVYGQGATARSNIKLTFADINLFDDSLVWRQATLGDPEERKAKLSDPAVQAALRADWDAGVRPGVIMKGSLGGLIVREVGRPDFEPYLGLEVGEIAEAEGKHVIDALLDLVLGDDLRTEFQAQVAHGSPNSFAEIARSPYVVPGLSDGGAHVKFTTGGCYPTELLCWLVRDEGLVDLEEAHYKLSYLPAFIGGFRDRGFLREGAPADVVVYDLEGLDVGPIEVAYDLPGGDWRRVQKPTGYRWTLVNGEVTLEDGEPSEAFPGKLLRHGVA